MTGVRSLGPSTAAWAKVQWISTTVAAAAMVATPLLPTGRRLIATSAVVAGLSGSTGAAAARRWGAARAALAAATIAVSTASVEKLGTTTGRPFGRYRYTGVLRPSVKGIPVAVPLAWFAMALPAREAAHAALGSRTTRARRVLLGAAALTAWDLFLDPQMVAEGYWRWDSPGRYRGIPLVNYAGWLVTAVGLMALMEVLTPPAPEPVRPLVGTYAGVAAMETTGFAAFFGDPTVAASGGAAMLPLGVLGVVRAFGPLGARGATTRRG